MRRRTSQLYDNARSLNPCCNGIYSMRAFNCSQLWKKRSLNPCCNGIYSMSVGITAIIMAFCLNPCCNGIYSMSNYMTKLKKVNEVLILVVMEYTQ